MELIVLGCSGSFGSPPMGACSGYLVRAGDATIWLDCGNGTLAALQDHVALGDLTAAVVTHRHPDHCVDLLGLHVALRWELDRRGFPVFAAPQVRERLRPLAGEFAPTFSWDEVDGGDERELGSVRLRFSRTDHSVPTLAVEIEADERRLVYSSDTAAGWSAADAFGPGPDLLLVEASYQDDSNGGGAHLTARQAGAMGSEAGAGALVITHLWPRLDPAVSVREAEEAYGRPVVLARPGVVCRVGAPGADD